MELGAELIVLSEILDPKSELIVSAEAESNGSEKYVVDDEESVHMDSAKSSVDFVEARKLSNDAVKTTLTDSFSDGYRTHKENLLSCSKNSVKTCNVNEVRRLEVEMAGNRKCDGDDPNGVEELDSQVVEKLVSSRKRKQDSMCRMLNWISGIARNPCDPVIVSLPDSSKWKAYGNGEFWKQILLVREALFLKRHTNSGAEQSICQRNQKIHPCMYDHILGSSYHLRDRLKCTKKLPRKESSRTQAMLQSSSSASLTDSALCSEGLWDGDSSTEHSLVDLPVKKHIPLGPHFQAELPEWTGVASESDSKWVGTRVWPLENVKSKFIIERGPTGKGRQDSCGCHVPKSIECVRFHIAERKSRMKRELGMAFYYWRFDKIGEEVKLLWTEEEEKKFKAIVSTNSASVEKCFWDEIFKFFHTKRREDLVSYYYNVFLLQHRAHQNRFAPNDLISDDEESEFLTSVSGHETMKCPGSLLGSAKKLHKKR